jgi:hypothetical protein
MTEDIPSPGPVTRLLLDWSDGDERARDGMPPLVYDELRRLAALYLQRERHDHTLHPTALVHEAYLRLIDQRRVGGPPDVDVIALHDALDRLCAIDSRKSRIVELKFFGGLTTSEIAAVLQLSPATIERDSSFARAWLYDAISGGA